MQKGTAVKQDIKKCVSEKQISCLTEDQIRCLTGEQISCLVRS